MFKKLRVTPELAQEAEVMRITTQQALRLGFTFKGDLSGIYFPYCDAAGAIKNARIRRDHPETNPKGEPENKYISMPTGHARLLYRPPGAAALLKDPEIESLLVEAEKSALAITAAARRTRNSKLVALALGGCWGWRERQTHPDNSKQEISVPIEDLEVLRGRKVGVMMDANVAWNSQVRNAELELCAYLASQLQASVVCYRLPVERGVNGQDDYLAKHSDADFWKLLEKPAAPWLAMVGESYEKYSAAKLPEFVIKDFLQTDGATFIGGLSGHGKTFMLFSMAQSLLTGEPLFGYFPVVKKATRVLYLTPEITLGSFRVRAEKFGLGPYIKSGQLIVRTLSAYPMLPLTDPAVLLSAQGADVFLDTAIRFIEGDESSSTDNDRGLAAGVFRLLQSGARTVVAAHHSPKGFESASRMALETVLRGTGDIGAMVSAAWGVRMLDRDASKVQVENIKTRDFQPPPPFQLLGRPHIDEGKGFQMALRPGECGYLADYVKEKRTGRPRSQTKADRTTLLTAWVREGKNDEEIAKLFAATDADKIAPATLQKELRDIRKQLRREAKHT